MQPEHATTKRRIVRALVELLTGVLGLALVVWAWRADPAFYERHMTFLFCFTSPSDKTWLVVKRAAAVTLGVAMVLWVRPRAGRFMARRWPEILGQTIVRVVLPVLAALIVADVILRYAIPRMGFPPIFSQVDDRYGWILIPSQATTLPYVGRDVTYAINARSCRARSIADNPDPSRPSILFGGESITLGHGLDYEQSYPFLVGQHLGMQSVDLAVHGYAADQIYLRTVDALADFPHTVAVVTLVLPNTINRIPYGPTPHLALQPDGSFTREGPGPRFWWSSPLRNLVIEKLWNYHDDEAVEVARAVLRETARAARAHGAYPVFLWTNYDPPCLPDAQGSPAIVRTMFDGLDGAHLRVDVPVSERLAGDQHPGAIAHVRMAAAVETALREGGVLQ